MAGHMRERTPGRWELRVYDPTAGKYKTRTVSAKSPRAADKLLDKFATDLAEGRVAKAPARLTLAKVADEWHTTRAYRSDATRRQSVWALKHLQPSALGRMPVRGVGLHDIQTFLRDLEPGLAPKSVGHVYKVLRMVLDYAQRARYIPFNPCDDLERGFLPTDDDRGDAPTPDDVITFLNAIRRHAGEQWLRATILLIATGIRRGELCGLQWRDVDLKRGTLAVGERVAVYIGRQPGPDGKPVPGGKELVHRAKTKGSRRKIQLGPHAVAMLEAHRAEAEEIGEKLGPESFVFSPAVDGLDFYEPNHVSQMFRRVRERAKLDPTVRPHQLRHFSATMAAKSGVPISEIMGRHGWVNYKTAMHYQHHTGTRDLEAANAAEAVFGLPEAVSE